MVEVPLFTRLHYNAPEPVGVRNIGAPYQLEARDHALQLPPQRRRQVKVLRVQLQPPTNQIQHVELRGRDADQVGSGRDAADVAGPVKQV